MVDYRKSCTGCRTPTLAQTRSMAWQAVVNGANGIAFYSYMDIERNPDVSFEKEWARLLEVATEIKSFVPEILSDGGKASVPHVTLKNVTATTTMTATATATATAAQPWLRMRARWVAAASTSTSASSSGSGGDGSSMVGGVAEYVVFAVADGTGSGAASFSLPGDVQAKVGGKGIQSVATMPSPFNGGIPSRAVPVNPDDKFGWSDIIDDMEMVAYKVIFAV